jgi:signal transduction histidine kinase
MNSVRNSQLLDRSNRQSGDSRKERIPMLLAFLNVYRDEVITRTREKLTNRPWPLASTSELENGISLFLTQLSSALEAEAAGSTLSDGSIAATAALHGRDLRAMGFNVSQVVHDYGDICQAITEVAIERSAPISAREFHLLNRCLDTAIAEAVTEHARITALTRTAEETERTGQLAHEIRDLLNTAVFAFEALRTGTVALNGSTGAVLGRSLVGLRELVASTLTEIRLTANHQHSERISAAAFCQGVAAAAQLNADYRHIAFTAESVAPDLVLNIDPQLLGSAVMNLLNNAFKFTRPGGQVTMRTEQQGARLHIEVADECGGIPDGERDLFEPFTERRGSDRSGLGLGLSIARKAVAAHGGEIHLRNRPGHGCVFTVDIPLAVDTVDAPVVVA